MKKNLFKFTAALSAIVLTVSAIPLTVSAHGAWFAQRCGKTQLVVGEGPKDESYDPDGLLSLLGFDADFNPVNVIPVKEADSLCIEPNDDTAVVYAELDYGYWSNNTEGKWIPKPMDEVEGSTIGTHALKYSVNYLKPVNHIQPISGLAYQIMPFVDPSTLKVGDTFPVVLLQGDKPMANQEIIIDTMNLPTTTITTDEDGIAWLTVRNEGVNVFGAEMVVPYENQGIDNKATRSKVYVSLSYTIYPEED